MDWLRLRCSPARVRMLDFLNLMLLLMSWLPFMNSFSLPLFSVTTGKAWWTVVRRMLTRDWMRVCG